MQGWQQSVRLGFDLKPNQTGYFSIRPNRLKGVKNRANNYRLTDNSLVDFQIFSLSEKIMGISGRS